MISIDGFEPNREYSVIRKTIGSGMGDALTAYREMGEPKDLSHKQAAELLFRRLYAAEICCFSRIIIDDRTAP